MSGQLRMFDQTICEGSPNAISSPASEGGATPYDSPDGRTTSKSGLGRVRASRLALLEQAASSTTRGILWPAWCSLITERQPATVFGEQVAAAARWLRRACRDLEAMGYAFGAVPIEAACIGAPHRRDRLWFVADAEWHEQPRQEPRRGTPRRVGREQQLFPWDGGWPAALARFRVVDDGIPRCVAATDAARNAIVPQVAAAFIEAYVDSRGLR